MSLIIGKSVVQWVAHQTNEYGDFGGAAQGIGWARNGEIVAGTAYGDWNGVNIQAHIASDRSKHWLTREYLWTIFDYPFKQLKVNRVTLCIGEGNKDSIRFAKHLGFELETSLKNAHPTGDLLIFCMKRDECKYIKAEFKRKLCTLEDQLLAA